jgi:uncharacterized membrane protein
MWKEFILLLLLVAVGYVAVSQGTKRWKEWKITDHWWTFLKKHALLQFILLFVGSAIVFFFLAVVVQRVELSPFILSLKYDLLPFFIFGLGACIGVLIFTEKDKELFQTYKKLMIRCLRGGIIWWVVVYFSPNVFRHFGYDGLNYEGTI